MSRWDQTTHTIVSRSPKPWPGAPGWWDIDCGCCNGIEWGGEEPHECRTCGGMGSLAWHEKSHVLAEYPGGRFCGRDDQIDVEVSHD